MGKAREILSGVAVAPGAALTVVTPALGDAFTIRNFTAGKAQLLTAWPTGKTTLGEFQIRSPRMHDNVLGITLANPVVPGDSPLFIPKLQDLVAQDALIASLSGSAGALEQMLLSLIIAYEDLPGIEGNFITPEELKTRGVDTMTVFNALVPTAGGTYEGPVAINATDDLMKANTPYALVGYMVTVGCHAVTWRGSDTGNLRIGGPGRINGNLDTRNYFVKLSELSGLPCIPVFNSANKANTFVEVVSDEVAAISSVYSIFVQLSVS